jgi:aminopeptidase N
MRSADVLRIKEVGMLRARQFREDNGPLAHPVRPEEYIEINNFYTATVYEKGAEVVRMLHTLVGAETYRKALDLYFERHDGQACTIEDFKACFEEASGRDLTQFKRWWSQAGTPRVRVTLDHADGETVLTVTQNTPATPGQAEKAPLHIPFAVGFLSESGEALTLTGPDGEARETHVLELTRPSESFAFSGADARPVPSLLRGFSAPVILDYRRDDAERALLLAHDTDAFNRSEAARDLALGTLMALAGGAETVDPTLPEALDAALRRGGDPAFLSLLLATPGQEELAAHLKTMGEVVDPEAIYRAKTALDTAIAETAREALLAAYEANAVDGPYSPDAGDAGKRALRNTALGMLVNLENGPAAEMAKAQFEAADNMTDSAAALTALVRIGGDVAEDALAAFHARWKGDMLVVDKWLTMQVAVPREDALERAKALRARDDIDWRNPNRFRSLVGAFASNHWRFHQADGSGSIRRRRRGWGRPSRHGGAMTRTGSRSWKARCGGWWRGLTVRAICTRS